MDSFIEKLQVFSGKLGQNRVLMTISHGLMGLMPALMVGSIGTLLQQIPFDFYQSFITSTGLMDIFKGMVNVTTNMLAVYASFALAYTWANQEHKDGFAAGVIALVSFLLVTPTETVGEGYMAVTNLPLTWLGSTGLFTAMIVSIVAAKIYCLFIDKNITIKMPDSVPLFVSKSFNGIIPAIAITIIFAIVGAIMAKTPFGSLHSVVYALIAAPLGNIGGSVWTAMLMQFLGGVCWFCGIHGMAIAMVTAPIYMAADAANMAAISAGTGPTNIISQSWNQTVGNIGGAGCTLGLVILCCFLAKSERYKQMGKIAIIPSLFGINEPVVFGMPMVLNFVTAIPFLLLPSALIGISYLLVTVGILPVGNGVGAPTNIPGLMGFLNMGWRGAVWNIIEVLITIVAYYPFFKVLDNQAIAEEQGGTTEE